MSSTEMLPRCGLIHARSGGLFSIHLNRPCFWERTTVRTYRPLRPRLLDTLVASAVRSAVSGRYVLNIGQEARRIAAETGFAVRTVASELVVAGIQARADLEFPKTDELDPFTAFLNGRRRSVVWRTLGTEPRKNEVAAPSRSPYCSVQ
jgi:hypothetical protein